MSKSPVYSRIAAKHVNLLDRVKPEPVENPAELRRLQHAFGVAPFTVRKAS